MQERLSLCLLGAEEKVSSWSLHCKETEILTCSEGQCSTSYSISTNVISCHSKDMVSLSFGIASHWVTFCIEMISESIELDLFKQLSYLAND